MRVNDDENTLIKIVEAVGNLKIEIWTSDFQHALDGHPEVTLDKIGETLVAPYKVIESKRSARACLFYSVVIEDQDCETRYFCVVVGVLTSGKGKVETAYETTYIKNGKILFPQGGKDDD